MDKVRIGIIGCGGIANQKHMPALKKLEDVEMVAFCDIIEERAQAAAAKFGVSKSTVHKDISERLPLYDRRLYLQAREVLELNKAQRHIRGGIATRRKYRRD